jgi:hypothetical protein
MQEKVQILKAKPIFVDNNLGEEPKFEKKNTAWDRILAFHHHWIQVSKAL